MSDMTVQDDAVVTLTYTLTLDDGTEVDAAGTEDPLVYLHGHDNIIPGLEIALTGLKVGDSRQVSIAPANAYGDFDPDAIVTIPYEDFPDDIELEEGMALELQNERTGEFYEAFIEELSDEGAIVDLNHPLAGEALNFDVTIVAIRAATRDELDHGHPHGPGGAHA